MIKRGRLHFLLYGFLTLLVAILVVTLALPEDETMTSAGDDAVILENLRGTHGQHNAILPIPHLSAKNLQSGKVRLGEKLFHDPQLSVDKTISCASCHVLSQGGDDGRKFSLGVNGAVGDVNAPTVFNSIFGFRQFWDGRAANLIEQVSGPLTNPSEMASNWIIAIRRVSENPAYLDDFRREYGGEISEKTITDALVRFESTLITPDAPFDRFLNGDATAINDEAKEGFRRFSDYGCISCHQGVGI
ncbi:MAG: cytochrome-c peroxidase, partial [Azoarcus sp.]|nr:cytochrome-c peroxidase [Azoarcus sp.]